MAKNLFLPSLVITGDAPASFPSQLDSSLSLSLSRSLALSLLSRFLFHSTQKLNKPPLPLHFPLGYTISVLKNSPTVKPTAIWIMPKPTSNTTLPC